MTIHFGVDFGGTKTEIIALEQHSGREIYRQRIATDRSQYDTVIRNIAAIVHQTEHSLNAVGTVGVAIPGSLHPQTQLIRNSNSVITNGRAMGKDLSHALQREVRVENDANCLVLSEARDGAAKDHSIVFGVIIGTGSGGGLVMNGQLIAGANGIAGEWGHNPLPFPVKHAQSTDQEATAYFDQVGKQATAPIYRHKAIVERYSHDWADTEYPGIQCYCGKRGCIETWLSGTGFSQDFERCYGERLSSEAIIEAMRKGDERAQANFRRYCQRMAKSLAQIINIIDPDVIVLGGGMSNIDEIYALVPQLWSAYVFAEDSDTPMVKALHGDSSGVRGAAWLWQ